MIVYLTKKEDFIWVHENIPRRSIFKSWISDGQAFIFRGYDNTFLPADTYHILNLDPPTKKGEPKACIYPEGFVEVIKKRVKSWVGVVETSQGKLVSLPDNLNRKTLDTLAGTSSGSEEELPDMVNSPSHYQIAGMQVIDIIEAANVNYRLGNTLKYIFRADHKGAREQDLRKAMWYLQRELDQVYGKD